MIFGASGIVSLAALLTLNLFAVAALLAMLRLLKGPSLADRVVALDLIAALAVGTVATYAIYTAQPMLLRAAIVVALVAFVGTVAFATFLEKRGEQ